METTTERMQEDFRVRMERAVEIATQRATEALQVKARDTVPHHTGILAGTIRIEQKSWREFELVFPQKYAGPLEHGSIELHPVYFFTETGEMTAFGRWAQEKLGLSVEQLKRRRKMMVNVAHPFVGEIVGLEINVVRDIFVHTIIDEINRP